MFITCKQVMKLYLSIFTYLPFVYFVFTSFTFGAIYHSKALEKHKPFVILATFLLNTFCFMFYRNSNIASFKIHQQFWKAATMCLFGILLANLNELLFKEFEIIETGYNILISLFYLTLLLISTYVTKSDSHGVYINVLFLFFPLKRVWQVNLYVYVILTISMIVITYSKCTPRSIVEQTLYLRPLIRFFVYLRIHEFFILFGFVQLLIEYQQRYVPSEASITEIESILAETKDVVEKISTDYETTNRYIYTNENDEK